MPLAAFFGLASTLEHLVVNPAAWVLETIVDRILRPVLLRVHASTPDESVASVVASPDARAPFARATSTLRFQRVQFSFWVHKALHIRLFAFAYLRYAL